MLFIICLLVCCDVITMYLLNEVQALLTRMEISHFYCLWQFFCLFLVCFQSLMWSVLMAALICSSGRIPASLRQTETCYPWTSKPCWTLGRWCTWRNAADTRSLWSCSEGNSYCSSEKVLTHISQLLELTIIFNDVD